MQKPKISILVIALKSPILVGIYKQNNLIKTYNIDGKTSDILPQIFQKILQQFTPQALFYANGPGSYMSIKLTYIFLRTLSIMYNIPLKASLAFHFCQNRPIKALGKKYFVLENNEVKLKNIQPIQTNFELPQTLDNIKFDNDNEPKYFLPAV